ncbi:6-phosphogluconate dehydrogenase C-terminal domain-like protein [Sistotremastrum niveocremeum HHB9708]|uniref:6-phosphogluconate dehydrogenase C-terminal domain-like protein n=1 Tax=Sistotremastrum niveocremeum HHB9708 TaxID=1314777 RepID=A0A164PSD4_9AGAM|nr:6-phosphogluconate dehydrogenase C-terminal domain-like protein [Sistotremastrum niveocremeum HHB9708]
MSPKNSLTIAVVSAGAMGAGVGRRLANHGAMVLTNLDGRSAASHQRAKDAGMEIVTLSEIVSRADWVLSIVPPSEAYTFAKLLTDAYRSAAPNARKAGLKFADCNATSPETVKRISNLFFDLEIPFIDGSIIGGPPKDDYQPTFYASSNNTEALKAFDFGILRVKLLQGEGAGVGDASALKMSYAGISKGYTALIITMILSAHASSPATAQALLEEMHFSQPATLQRAARFIPDALPKAYRFVGEMEEISDYVKAGLGEGESHIHEGIARLYSTLAASVSGEKNPEHVDVLKGFVETAKKVLEDTQSPTAKQTF